MDDLNNAFETLRDTLLNKVREATMDELYTDLRQDPILQDRLKDLLNKVSTSPALATAMDSLLEDQLLAIQQYARSELEQMLGTVLHPAT